MADAGSGHLLLIPGDKFKIRLFQPRADWKKRALEARAIRVAIEATFGTAPAFPRPWEDFDPSDIQREAAMFYGLFLRGHDADQLRRDIEIPKETFDRWLKHPLYDIDFRESVKRIYYFRRKVLAVFDELVDQERIKARLQ